MAITITKYAEYVPWDVQGVGISYHGGGAGVDVDLSSYYTITQLQTSGQSEVHFDNIIEAYHNLMLDIQGGISSSSGDQSGNEAEYYHLDLSTYLDVINISFVESVVKDSLNQVSLVNDENDPGNSKYYGTDSGGTKGWFDLPTAGSTIDSSGLEYVSAYDTPLDNQVAIFIDEDTVEGNVNFTFDGSTFYMIGDIQTDDDDSNVKLGVGALASVTDGSTEIAIGKNALAFVTTGIGNTAIGEESLYTTTDGEGNIAIGYATLYSCTSGAYNFGMGIQTLGLTTTGSYNLAIGYAALYQNVSGNHNIIIGNDSGNYCQGSPGYLDQGNYNIQIGHRIWASNRAAENEIIIGNEGIGQGSNTTMLGGIDNATTYLTGGIYCVEYDSDNNLSGSLPLADSSVTQVVMYDPATGKLYYGAGEGGTVAYTFSMSLNEDSTGTVTLDNDEDSPGNSKYYGTDAGGTKGFFDLPAGGEVLPFQTASFANPLEIDCTTYKDWICTVIGDCTVNLNNANDGDAGMLELIIDGDSSGAELTITFGAMWTKKLGLVNLDTSDGEDNIISWRAIGDGSTQEIVYTIGQIEV